MNPKQSDISRCYVCVGSDEDGDCGNKIRPEGGFKLTQICEYGCLVSTLSLKTDKTIIVFNQFY